MATKSVGYLHLSSHWVFCSAHGIRLSKDSTCRKCGKPPKDVCLVPIADAAADYVSEDYRHGN
jgi:hypothetical protein